MTPKSPKEVIDQSIIYCCDKLEHAVNLSNEAHCDTSSTSNNEQSSWLIFLPQTRSFLLNNGDDAIDISYCPWCSHKLPSDLTDELMDIIYNQLQLSGYDDPKLSMEYRTSQWWLDRMRSRKYTSS